MKQFAARVLVVIIIILSRAGGTERTENLKKEEEKSNRVAIWRIRGKEDRQHGFRQSRV